jgi:biopolymer transport protein TolR
MAMGAARRGRRGGFRDINITPLVDVMLVLVIVFMVTAPLLTTGLRINLPEVHAANTPVKDARLLVTVTKDEKVLFGEEDVTSHIDQALKDNPRVQKEHELYIRADKDARYGIVATVVAAARNSGVESLNLLVQPEIEPDTDTPDEKKKSGAKGP